MADRTDDAPLSIAFAIYFAMLVAGVFYLRVFALDTGLPMNWDRCLFWSANALTLTGFRIAPNGLVDFSPAGLVGVYVLMSAGALFSLIIGGMLVCRYARLAHSPAKIVAAAIFLMIAASLFGAGMLMTPERSFAVSLFEATGAIANCGMNIDGARPLDDWRLQLIILPLAAIGGLGLPVVIELFDRLIIRKPLSAYSLRILHLAAFAWVAAFIVLLGANHSMPYRENVLTSWTYAINARSLGADIYLNASLPRLTWWIIAGLMLVGQMPGGTGSGVRLLPLSTLWRESIWNGSAATSPALARAVSWVGLYAGLAIALFLLMMGAEPQISTDRLGAISAGALGNTGLSQDALALSTRGLILLSTAMLAGYLLPLRFMALIVPSND